MAPSAVTAQTFQLYEILLPPSFPEGVSTVTWAQNATNQVNWAVWLAIFVVCFSLPLLHEFVFFLRARWTIRRLTGKIRQLGKVTTEVEHQKVEAVFQSLAGDSPLRHEWDQYSKFVLRKPQELNGKTYVRVFKTFEAAHFFKDGAVRGHLRFLTPRVVANLPGTMTALGILGTFLGLILGLQGLSLASADAVKTGINQLVEGMNTAYYTSVWGVLASIVFVLIEKLMSDSTRSHLGSLTTQIDQRYDRLTEQQILIEMLNESAEQTGAIKSMSGDLVGVITQTLPVEIASRLVPVLEGMQKAVEDMARKSAQTSEAGVGQMIEQFTMMLDREFQGKFGRLADTMERSASQMQGATSRLTELMQGFSTALGQQQQVSDAVNRLLSSSQTTVESISTVTDGIKTTTEAQVSLVTDLTEAANAAAVRLISVKTSIETMDDRLSGAANGLSDQLARFSQLHTQLQESSQRMLDLLHRTEEVLRNSGDVSRTFQSLLGAATESQRASVSATEKLSAAGNAVAEKVGGLADVARNASEIGSKSTTAAVEISRAVSQMSATWAQHGETIQRLNEQLSTNLDAAGDQVVATLQRVMSSYDEQMGNAVQALTSGIRELEDVLATAGDRIEKAIGGTAKV